MIAKSVGSGRKLCGLEVDAGGHGCARVKSRTKGVAAQF